MSEKWPLQAREPIGDFRIFRLRKDVRQSPATGADHAFFVIESSDWVNVVAVTPDEQVVLIRQFRHGVAEECLEIPGGMVDAEDGDPAVAAARELREETGYVAERMIPIGVVTPNPAILTNRCFTYLAHNARPDGAQQLDGTELIDVELAPLTEIPQLIGSGAITHALVVAAFYHYNQYRNGLGAP